MNDENHKNKEEEQNINYLAKGENGKGLIGIFEYCKDELCNLIIKEIKK